MQNLTSFQDFIERVNELGFMALSQVLPGFPCLGVETAPESWHTGNAETDPWQWKDRAAQEKKLAFGCVLGGHKGFISKRMYPLFYAACHPRESLEDQWTAGRLNQVTWRLWQLFGAKEIVSTDEIRRGLGVSRSQGAARVTASRLDAVVVELQRTFFITVAGNRRRINQAGLPYGWPANVYAKVSQWIAPDWLSGWAALQPKEAVEQILEAGEALGTGVKREELAKVLRISARG